MRARSVTTRNKRSLVVLDNLHHLSDVLHSLDTGGISPRPDQHEVVVHHWIALCALAFGEELLFRRLGMDEDHVGIAAPTGVECLASALCDDFDGDASLLFVERQQIFK